MSVLNSLLTKIHIFLCMLFLIFLGFIQKDIIYLTCSSRKAFLSHNWFKAKAKLDKSYEHLSNLRVDIYMKLWGGGNTSLSITTSS